jgi:hypothetical protein
MPKIEIKLAEYRKLRDRIKKEESRLKAIQKEERRAKRQLRFIEEKKERALSDRQIFILKTPLERIQESDDEDERYP